MTQCDAASSGTVVDEVGFSFDGWGNVTDFDQDHNSVVNGDAYELAHAYAKATGGRQTVRRSGTTLPNGDAVSYSYSSSGGAFDDALSRVSGISHGATSVVRYAYDGAGFVSRTTLPTISMVNGTTTPTLGTWVGLDRHNRPIIWKWYWASNSNVTAYDEELGWDRANNVLWRKDHFHDGFDVAYDIDELNRVTRAEEGTVTAGAITATSRDQQWTLDHLGNWGAAKLDLDGDGVFTGTDELDEARTHNTVNELLARDIDNDSTDDFTQVHDALGNLTDDGQNYTYTWDAFGRLREIRNRSTTDLVQELRYNGLGFLIAEHYDADEDGDVDGSDPWYHHVWDERWRLVATFRAGDSDPKEQYVLHNAGFDGRGGSSYINDVVLRDRDANTAWTAAADGTLEERLFYLTNWRHDVVALLDTSRRQVEHTRYSAYGTPFAMPAGDTDSDGDCDAADITQIDTWIAGTIYDLRGDLNLDGVVNATDKSIATGTYQGTTLGRGALSSHGNRLRWAGMQDLLGAHPITHVRNRAYSAELGRWLSRDPLGYVDGMGLSHYPAAFVVVGVDPSGLTSFVAQEEKEEWLIRSVYMIKQWGDYFWMVKTAVAVGGFQSPGFGFRYEKKFKKIRCEAMMRTLQEHKRGPECTSGWDHTPMNAAFHCTVACMLTQATNPTFAWGVTTAYELNALEKACKEPLSDKCLKAQQYAGMDYHNNNVGIGLAATSTNCAADCEGHSDLVSIVPTIPTAKPCEVRSTPWTQEEEDEFMKECMEKPLVY